MKLKARSFAAALVFALPMAASAAGVMTVYKDPHCGCCGKWVEHMKAAGFQAKVIDSGDMAAIKQARGVTRELASCHTTEIDGYVIEGHVPAADVRRLLEERPKVAGLAAPGMPMGSPGMEGPVQHPYQVLSFDKDGKTAVFARH